MQKSGIGSAVYAFAVLLAAGIADSVAAPQGDAQSAASSACAYTSLRELPGLAEAREQERAGQFKESFDAYSRALDALRGACGKQHALAAKLLSNRAMIAIRLGRYRAAEEDLTIAEGIARSGRPFATQVMAQVLYTRGSLRFRLDQLAGAEQDLRGALELLTTEPDVDADAVSKTRTTLAGVYYTMGEAQRALDELLPVVEAYRQNPKFPEFANTLGNLGELYRVLGDMENAARFFQESIKVYESEGGPGHIGSALPMNNLALTHMFKGEYDRAESYLNRALELRRLHFGEVHPQIADTLLNLGGIAVATGQYGQAFTLFEAALEIQQQIYAGDHESIADSYGDLGTVMTALASHEEAIGYLEQAVEIRRRLHGDDFYGNASDLSNLSVSYRNLGRYDEAEAAAIEAIRLLEKGYGSDYLSMYGMYIELSRVYVATNRPDEAMTSLRQGLEFATEALGEDHPDIARLKANIGHQLLQAGDVDGAKAALRDAHASLAGQAGRPDASAEVHAFLSELAHSQSEDALAIYFGKRSVNDLQELRAGAVDLDTALQRRYLASVEQVYRQLLEILIDTGRLAEAQQVLAMLKEEEYSEFTRLRSSAESAVQTRAVYTAQERAWHDRYSQIEGEFAAVGETLAELQEQRRELEKGGASMSGDERAELEALQIRQREIRRDFNRHLDELHAYFASVGGEAAIEFGRKDLDSLQALQGILRRIEHVSGERVVLLTYLITSDRLRILLTSSNTLLHREVDVNPQVLNRLVFELRGSLQDVKSDPKAVAHELYRYLVSPVQDALDVIDADILLTSLDGALRYLPISVLHDGERYLAQHYAVGVFTPAAKLTLERRPDRLWTAAGMGVTEPGDEYLSLPLVGMELDRIVRESSTDSVRARRSGDGDSGILDGRIWMNESFTAGTLSDALVSGFKVIHIASHFVFKPGTERDSFLVLGGGDKLTLEEFVAGAYRFDDVDLLTLSACDTALGSDAPSGKEIEGFGALAQNKGAGAVLATLWPVADATTAEFMARFYEYRQVRGMSKAQSLRAVQRDFITGDKTLVAEIQDARGGATDAVLNGTVRHPFYWAPFVLMGNWQ